MRHSSTTILIASLQIFGNGVHPIPLSARRLHLLNQSRSPIAALRCFVAQISYPVIDFLDTGKSGKSSYILLKGIFRSPGRANDRTALVDHKFHAITFFEAQALPNLLRNCNLTLAADGAGRQHLYSNPLQ